jgi:2-polyprenyl-6-methoxyphenol hydroxylase-like FAD-dependent oxidoreductase
MAPLKVLIIGGGIAGPALVYWLSRISANITLIERSPSIRASGQQVDLRAQGVPMMKKMGIEQVFVHGDVDLTQPCRCISSLSRPNNSSVTVYNNRICNF